MNNQMVFPPTDRLHRIAVTIFYACAAVSIAFAAMVLIAMASGSFSICYPILGENSE